MSNSKFTKKDLYDSITNKILELGLDPYSKDYKINSIDIAHKVCKNLEIEYLEFKERKICGILFKGENSTSIALNNRRSCRGKNFDCMHEVVHYWLHDDNYFYCNENSNEYYEWQANEGAAQFLLPYQMFIPKFTEILYKFNKIYEITHDYDLIFRKTNEHLCWAFDVGEKVIENRVKSLKGEIAQYCETNSIKNINIISLTQQGINKKYNKNGALFISNQ